MYSLFQNISKGVQCDPRNFICFYIIVKIIILSLFISLGVFLSLLVFENRDHLSQAPTFPATRQHFVTSCATARNLVLGHSELMYRNFQTY